MNRKLSRKDATRIATLFNSVAVGEFMRNAESLAALPYDAARRQAWELWYQHSVDAAAALYSEYGISVVSY